MKSVIVTRPRSRGDELTALLEARGIHVHAVPTIAIELFPVEVDALSDCDWIVVTSAEGVAALPPLPAAARVAAVGDITATALRRRGIAPSFVPAVANGAALGESIPDVEGRFVVLVRGSEAAADLPIALRRRGATVKEITAYRTIEGSPAALSSLRAAVADTSVGAVVFASGSAARGFVTLGGPRLPAITIGPRTTTVARELGFEVIAEARRPNSQSLAEAVVSALEETNHA